ncbi:MAG: M23 family metallopeptidase [Treponema sp.]|jgi:murein DD-endopeptidase MepM/ murein hydrolase activator NlpD|nr:M23 family metallopeptidase [Treponema sp.]
MEKRGKGTTLAFFLIVFTLPANFAAEDSGRGSGPAAPPGYPVISRLDPRDTGFRQYLQDVETSRQRLFTRERTGEAPEQIAESLTIYRYVPGEGEDIFTVAARCNIPYAGIATLNRFCHPAEMEGGEAVLLPSIPGIFIPREPVSDLERLTASARASRREEAVILTINQGGQKTEFFFYPGADFSPTERNFFLNPGFRFPLRVFRLTSPYGMRQNPITGQVRLHEGMDLAAPEGTEVYAAGDGIVTETGEDPVYGRYIIIKHGENWATLYGHLQKIDTALRSEVRSGSLIGRVGSTGQSTGPHLHFELRRNGQARDPGKYLFQSVQQ